MQLPETVQSYLKKHSSNHWKLEWNWSNGIENVIVVPAISEFENIRTLLCSLTENDEYHLSKTLILFVVNNLTSSNVKVKEDNQESLVFLRKVIAENNLDAFTSRLIKSGLIVGLVDAASKGNDFTDKTGGVGIARKVGMDLALTAFDYSIPKKKVIISLDADCKVDSCYLSSIAKAFNDFNLNAATIEFTHNINSHSYETAILTYEIFLRHYVTGLLFAQSPYAYHAIGSALACDYESYIKMGGMNIRQAAEDFYFLQKLAKVYKIAKINTTVVSPSARESWRVPFGTGKSVMQFQSGEKQCSLYDPQVFKVLKEWIELFNSDVSLNPELLLQKAKDIHTELYNYLVLKNFPSQWDKILNNCKSEKQLNYQRKNWFDAFNTLKLIHHLRDTAFPMREIFSAIEEMLKLLNYNFDFKFEIENDTSTLKKYLRIFKEIENSFSEKETVG
jgi:hypothetical protein